MVASHEELRKRRGNNDGNLLSSKDYNEVFNDIVAKDFKARGYYDDKYWSQVQVSQGLPCVAQTEEERMYKEKLNAMENKMECMSDFMKYLLTFMSKRYPEDDLVKEMKAFVQDETDDSSDHECTADDISKSYVSKHIDGIHEDSDADVNSPTNVSKHTDGIYEDSNTNVNSPANASKHIDGIHEDSNANMNSPANENMAHGKQQQKSVYRIPRQTEVRTSIPREQPSSKETQLETQDGNVVKDLSSDPVLHNMRTRRVKASSMCIPESRQEEVYLLSLLNKGRVVAKGKLVTTDSQKEIFGTMLGSAYCGVYVEGLENIERGNKGHEEVPRPFEKIRTLIDVVGYVIAWPTTHVKKARSSSRIRNKLVPATRGQS